MVVLQIINPKWATAQNWSQPFHFHFVVFSRRIRSPYKILSKLVEKQKSYVSAQLAPEANYEKDNVRKSRFSKITCSNHILTAIVMPPGIFQLVISMVMTYCKVTEIFITLGIFCHAGRSEDELKTINLLWKGQCPKVIIELFWVVKPWRVSFFFLFFSSMSLLSCMLIIVVVLTLLSGFMYRFDALCLELLENVSFEHRYWRLMKIQIGQKLKQIVLCGWEIC